MKGKEMKETKYSLNKTVGRHSDYEYDYKLYELRSFKEVECGTMNNFDTQ
jgi:hypothetical protein